MVQTNTWLAMEASPFIDDFPIKPLVFFSDFLATDDRSSQPLLEFAKPLELTLKLSQGPWVAFSIHQLAGRV